MVLKDYFRGKENLLMCVCVADVCTLASATFCIKLQPHLHVDADRTGIAILAELERPPVLRKGHGSVMLH